jgi:neutral amino acid transport system permease protein
VSLLTDTLPEGVFVTEGAATTLSNVSVQSGQVKPVIFRLGAETRDIANDWDLAAQLSVEGLRFGLLLALASIGLSLVYGTTGLVNFAHAELVTLGAIVAWYINDAGVQLMIAVALTVLVCGALGGVQDLALWRQLRRRSTGLIAMMITSIGLSILLRYFFQYIFGAETRSYADYSVQAGIEIGPIEIAPRDLIAMGIAIVMLLAVAYWLMRTRLGKATRAVADNPPLAAASGIDVQRVILVVWIIGGALAGLGGTLLGLSQQVRFDLGFQILLLIFAAVTLGGLGTAFGALVGSLVVGVFVTVSTVWIPSELKNVSALGILILILLVRPQGILGRAERVG